MGRISKARIDKIAKLREEGYLQKEVAQKVGLDIKTVRKYDPERSGAEGSRVAQNLPRETAPPFKARIKGEPTLENLRRRIEALEATVSRQLLTLSDVRGNPIGIQQLCPNCAKDGIERSASIQKRKLLSWEDLEDLTEDMTEEDLYLDVMCCSRCRWIGDL